MRMARCLRLVIAPRNCATSAAAQDDWELHLLFGRDDALHDPVLAESHAVEKSEGADRLAVIAPRDALLLDEENEVSPDFLRAQKLGRLAEVLGERGDPVNIGLDRVGREIAEFHVLDHSLTQGSRRPRRRESW